MSECGRREHDVVGEVVVLGSGPGGYTAAFRAADLGLDTVLVDGRIVKRGGKLTGYDVDKIVREAKQSALRVRTAAGGRLAPPAVRW